MIHINSDENVLVIANAVEARIVSEFSNGDTFKAGDVVFHDHVLGKYRRDPIDMLPACVKSALRQCRHVEPDDPSQDLQLDAMPVDQLFELYCDWEGLINWSTTLTNTIDALRSYKLSQIQGVPVDASWSAMSGGR